MLRLGPIERKIEALHVAPGAIWHLRRPTSFETTQAAIRASEIIRGLRIGNDAQKRVSVILGRDIEKTDFEDQSWVLAAIERVSLVELAVVTTDRWEGIGDDSGSEIVNPDRANIIQAMQDNRVYVALSFFLSQDMHTELSEGKELPTSQNGAQKVGGISALIAGVAGMFARSDNQ